MIRWFDYLLAFVMADFILSTFIVFVSAPNLVVTFFSALSLFFLFDLWNKYYCNFRLKIENRQ